jgi:hypothetical protein
VLPRDLSDDPTEPLGMAEIFEHDPHKRKPGSGRRGVKLEKSARRGGSAGASGQRGGLRAARAPPTQPYCDDYIFLNCDQALNDDLI